MIESLNVSNDLIIDKKISISVGLAQNYPNPFNPSTNIQFSIPTSQQVTLSVYDGFKNAGSHSLVFDAKDLASGVYIYQLVTSNVIETKKMLLIN